MVTINLLEINPLATQINVNVSTSSGNTIDKVVAWTIDTYKDYSKAIDLSSKLSQSSNTEVFSVSKADLEVEDLSNIFFFEFTSSENVTPGDPYDNSNQALSLTSNFKYIYDCMLNEALKLEFQGCEVVCDNTCGKTGNPLYGQTLLSALNSAITLRYFEEAVRINKQLRDLCDSCGCPNKGTEYLIEGTGFETSDNSIIIS